MQILFIYLAIINAFSYLLMLVDKVKAKKKRRRIPERTLLLVCAIGGSIGGMIGMKLFRHKTLHPQFTMGIPVMLAVQVSLFILFFIVL